MRIDALRLIAYGSFSGKELDLSAGNEGFHLIYGLNEAGKSTALRAFRHILYGIPERSTDNFQHAYGKMRIGATIRSRNGHVLEFIRRKGRGNTLRAADDKTLIETTELEPFLRGVGQALFVTMFGIGYEDLIRGGQEIIQGGGDVGRLVFAAGSGISNLREIQNELGAAADGLFRPSGKNPRINQSLSRIHANRKALRQAQLPGQEWAIHDEALRKAVNAKQVIEDALIQKQRELSRLDRIQQALPVIARRRELLEGLDSVASAVLLPEDFGKKRLDLITKLRVAQKGLEQARQNIKEIEQQMSRLDFSQALMASADIIEELYRELGSLHKASKDRVQLETHRNVSRHEAKEILRGLRDDLSLEDTEQLRIKKADTIRIQELSASYERIVTRLNRDRKDSPRLKRAIAGLTKQLASLPSNRDVSQLKEALEQALEFGPLEKVCLAETADINSALQNLDAEMSKQGVWTGPVDLLQKLPVPSQESIGLFENDFHDVDLEIKRIKSDIERAVDALAQIEQQREELHLEQGVPTERDLAVARETRDHGWQLVYGILSGHNPQEEGIRDFIQKFPPSNTITEAYVTSVRQADDLADRLRREADRVAKMARLHAEQTGQRQKKERLEGHLEDVTKRRAGIMQQWEKLWEPTDIRPRTPREMRLWAHDHKALSTRAADILDRSTKRDALESQIEKHGKSLEQCLQSLSESTPGHHSNSLADLIKHGEKIIDGEKTLTRQRDQRIMEKEKREEELVEVRMRAQNGEQELLQWRTQWEQAVQPLGLNGEAIPSQANAVIEDIKTLFDKLKDAENFRKRIYGIDCDKKEFGEKVSHIIDNVAVDLQGLPAEKAVMELNTRLTKARALKIEEQALARQRHKEEIRAEKDAEIIHAIEAKLQAMCEEAGCGSYEILPDAEKRSEKRRQIETDLQAIDEGLRQLSGGATVTDFINEALKVDSDAMDGQIAGLKETISGLGDEKSELDRTIGSEQTELKKMDGSGKAAELAEDIQRILGSLENDVEQYARQKIAARILGHAIDIFRDKNQGPILKKAASLFRQITGESFYGIRAEFDEKGLPVLVGIRSGNREHVPVDCMSEGTADQLYLALRMAGLEEYLDKNEPMPFIVDDILIKFDDVRAEAALRALAQLSAKTQVIFLTHHRHLLELAGNSIDPSILVKHTLD